MKPFIKKTLACTLILLAAFSENSSAARYWIANLPSNWNNTANWSASSGGAGGASVPGSGDDVNFDGNGLGTCTIDALVNIRSITVASGYIGTIAQGANTITVVNNAAFSGGIFAGGTANITIGGSWNLNGTLFTSTSGVLELDNTVAAFTSNTFIHNSGTVKLKNTSGQTLSGTSPTFYNLEFVGVAGTYTLSSTGNITVMNGLNTSGSQFYNLATGIIDVKGNINSANTATGCGGDALININGTGSQSFTGSLTPGAGALPQLTINKSLGTLTLSNYPAVSNNFTYTAGTVSAGTSTFCFIHGNTGAYTITGSLSLANIEFPVNTSLLTITIPAATTLTATGDLTLAGAGNLILNTGNINVNGNLVLTNTGNGGGGTATINLVGTGSQNLDGSAITVNQSRLPILNINKSSGTLSLLGNISFASNVTYTAGTVDPGISTCYVVNNITMTGNLNLYNLTVLAAGNTTLTIASGSTVSAGNTLDLENAANYITINTGTIAVQGNIIDNNSSLIGGGTGTILINGSGAQTMSSTGIIDQGRLPSVTINKPSGTLILPSLITVRGDWTYTTGTVDVVTNNSTVVFENTMNISGTQTLNHIIFDGSNNYNFTTAVGTTVTVLGNISMIGTGNITLNTGTFNLNGNLLLNNTGGGGGTSLISFVGTTGQIISSSLAANQNCLPSISINKTSGTLTFPALITVRGNWTYTAGTLDVVTNNSTIIFADPLGIGLFGMTGSHTLNNVSFEANNNNTLTMSTGTVLTITGTLATLGTANMFINTPVTGATAIQAQGNISVGNTGSGGGGTGSILINGTTAQAFSSSVAASKGQMPYITIQKSAGTLTLSGIISESRDWTLSSGSVDAGTNSSTVVFGSNNLSVASAGMSFYHVTVTSSTTTLSGNLNVDGNLTINGTGVLAPGANTINLKGNWTNRATAGFTEATSTVNFNGTALQTITSPGGENFTNLLVNNSSTGVQLVNAVAVATGLTMTQGNMDLNGNALTLGTSALLPGTLTYSAGTMINTGSFTRWIAKATIPAGGAAGLYPVGTAGNYQPFNVTIPTAPTTGGTITVAYTATAGNTPTSFSDGGSMVQVRKNLNWAVSTATLAGGSYDLEVSGTGYGSVGLVGDLRLTLAGSVVGTAGVNAGTVTNPQVNRTGLTPANLSNTFYMASVNPVSTSLPVTLLYFTATESNDIVKLDWATAAEFHNDHFSIQRSSDGSQWQEVGTIAAKGNAGNGAVYSSYDADPLSGLSYYRLVQVDLDGKQSYSSVQSIDIRARMMVSLYPNPATNSLVISSGTKIGKVGLYASNGQEIHVAVTNNNSGMTLNVGGLPAGVYYIHILTAGKTEVTKSFLKK